MRVLAVLALAASAVHATPVSVCRDATYEIPASRGAICSGAGASPAGKACPLKGDTAAASCHPYLPSYNGKACVAKEDAVCDLVNGNTWGCVFPSAGCPTAVKKPATPPPVTLAPTLKPPLVVTFEAKCPNWDYVGDDIVMPDIFELEPASNPALADIFKTESVSWYTEEIPPSELTKCNDKPTPRPTTAAPTTAPPPTTPAPTATTPRPVVTTPAPIVTTPAPTTRTPIPTTTAPPPTTPAPTTRTPPPTTTAPPPTPPPTTTAPPPTPPPTTTAPPPTPPPTTTPPPTPPPTTTPPPTPPVTTPCVITDPPTTAPPPTTTAPPPPPPTPTTTGPITYYPTGFPSLSPSTPTPPVPFFPTGVPAVAPTNGVSAENAREEHVPASAPTPTPPRAGSLAGVQPQTVSLMSEAGVPSSKADGTGPSPVVMVAVVAVVAVVVGGLFAAAQAKQRQRRGRTMSEDFALNMVVTPQ